VAGLGTDIVGIRKENFDAFTKVNVGGLSATQLSVSLTSDQILALDQIPGIKSILQQAQQIQLSANANYALVSRDLQSGLTPLALDLDGNGVKTVSSVAGAVFDVNADGKAESVGWLSAGDGWLALDRNQNGIIDDGSELFGVGTTLASGKKAVDGFEALRALDTNKDGVINAADTQFSKLSVWVDANSNARTDKGELKSVAEVGVQSLSLVAKPTAIVDQGNLIGLMGSYTTADGRSHELADVWLTADALGARVVDLGALDHSAGNAGTLARVTFSGNGAGDTMKVSLKDVLSFGDTEVIPGLGASGAKQMVVSGEAQDTVQLADAASWALAGHTTIGDASYRVLVQGSAQLLIEDKVKIVTV